MVASGKACIYINRRFLTTLILITGILLPESSSVLAQIRVSVPETRKDSVVDDYFGTKVPDPYRWLEDDRSPSTEAWVSEENQVTYSYLEKLPMRNKLNQRLSEIWNYNRQSAPFKKGDYFFCYKNTGLQNQDVLYMAKAYDAPAEQWTVVIDPNKLSNDGTVSLGGVSISKDCHYLSYSISKAGSDWQEIHFMDMATLKDLPDILKWVKFSGMSWRGKGIYYSRYDEPSGNVYSQKNTGHKVFYHELGSAQKEDKLIFKDDAHPDYNFSSQVTEDEHYLIIYASQSTSGSILFIKDLTKPQASFIQLRENFESENSIIHNANNTFFLLTNQNAPKYKLDQFELQNEKVKEFHSFIPEGELLLEHIAVAKNKFILSYLKDACSQLIAYDWKGKQMGEIQLPGICKVRGIHTNKDLEFATYTISQFIAPDQVYYLDANSLKSNLIFKPTIDFNSDQYVTKQVFYTSKGGTKIPMFITHKRDLTINDKTPCFVFGYGGFNISLGPEFRIDRALFLEAGGLYCVPNLRGGGEYGEEWHKAGTKCKKQNVFDDYISACEYLVNQKMTSYEKLAIHGRSNGGLLIGAVMTQRPDICKVALPTVGVLDMLRFHLFTIGRAWTIDYGCSENKEEFECLYKYSPYHNLKKQAYPATLILTGDHDDRVVPAHSFKFAARLQEMNTGKNPCLIRIDVNAGHGSGKPTSKQIAEFADMWAFTFYHLGMGY